MSLLKKIHMKHLIDELIQKRSVYKRIKKQACGDVYFIAPIGMGDTILFLSYVKELKKHYKIKKVCFIANSQRQMFISKFFSDIDKTIFYPNFPISLFTDNYYKKQKILYVDFFQKHLYTSDSSNTAKSGLIKFLNLPSTAKSTPPIILNDNYLKEKVYGELQNKYEQGKTIFISTDACALNEFKLPDEYWLDIAEKLTIGGFHVIFNSKEKKFYSYDTIFPPLETLKYYIEYFGIFIGFRSGICDYVANFCQAKIFVVYPKILSVDKFKKIYTEIYGPIDIDPTDFYYKKWSINNNYDRNTATEITSDRLSVDFILNMMQP